MTKYTYLLALLLLVVSCAKEEETPLTDPFEGQAIPYIPSDVETVDTISLAENTRISSAGSKTAYRLRLVTTQRVARQGGQKNQESNA